MSDATKGLTAALAAPFDPSEVKFKPQAVKGAKALAIAYVDARVVQDRLDEVLGVEGWSDLYELLADGSAVCRLSCKLGGEWVTKVDVGSPSEQPDAGDRVKAAFSDALKRAAVKFGVGRYLYRQPAVWRDYDPQRRQFVVKPTPPGGDRPKAAPTAAPGKAPDKPAAGPVPPELLARITELRKALGWDTARSQAEYKKLGCPANATGAGVFVAHLERLVAESADPEKEPAALFNAEDGEGGAGPYGAGR